MAEVANKLSCAFYNYKDTNLMNEAHLHELMQGRLLDFTGTKLQYMNFGHTYRSILKARFKPQQIETHSRCASLILMESC